jgi:hypothetical protein
MRISTGALYLGSVAGIDASDLALPAFAPRTMGCPILPRSLRRVGCEKLNETQALAPIYSLVILDRTEVTEEYRVYTPKNVFSGQIYENKGTVSEIPS